MRDRSHYFMDGQRMLVLSTDEANILPSGLRMTAASQPARLSSWLSEKSALHVSK